MLRRRFIYYLKKIKFLTPSRINSNNNIPKSLLAGNQLAFTKENEQGIYFEQLNKSWN